MKFLKFPLLIAALAVGFVSCNDDDDDDDQVVAPTQSITDVAVANGSFTILVDALQRTGLDEVLDNTDNMYTVFAPTDAAFGDLLVELNATSLDDVETALGTDGLKNVLLYHVLGGKVMAADVTTGFVNSSATRTMDKMDYLDMYIDASSGVKINDRAMVTGADVPADNGVIHVIDKVILPLNVVELALLSPDHTRLVAALGDADSDGDGTGGDLIPVLSDASATYTVFAPVNTAFSDIQATVDQLTIQQLATVLTYHVTTAGNVTADMVTAGPVPTVAGEDITIDTMDGVKIMDSTGDKSTVTATDIQGTNGVIHVLNRVLIPTL